MLFEDKYPSDVRSFLSVTSQPFPHAATRTLETCYSLPETRGLLPAPFKAHSFLRGKCVASSQSVHTHFGQHFCLPAAKGLWKGQFLGACRASFYTWHSPHAVPHMKGHAALLRPGKGTVCKEGLYEMSILSIESAALSLLTTWHIFCTVLPLSGDRREGGSL